MRRKTRRTIARVSRALVETLEDRWLLSSASVTTIQPLNGAGNVPRDTPVTADFFFPNAALDFNTVNTSNVTLFRSSDHAAVPSVVNTTGGDDAIVLQPDAPLDANTAYTFQISSGVHDNTGTPVTPFSMSFTTGTSGATVDTSVAFVQDSLATAQGVPFTTVRFGPDNHLWAASETGLIYRFPINPDGTLGTPQTFNSLQTANGGERLITGFAFDPHATASNPILWVSNGYPGVTNAPDFTSKITRMSGSSLQTVQDVVVGLPRSVSDHMTDQPVFGPDGALYFGQGAENSMGGPDVVWGLRPEHLLSSAILRLEVNKVTPGNPINVQTTDAGGSYNPFAPGAPLTIYAYGVRNAFDLLWASDGHLYAPVNGASAGGNTPAGGGAPALNDVPQVESDYLYDIHAGGYYGHPNPSQGHFVLDGGNPTAGADPQEISAYPVGTQPDPAYQRPVFDFGLHRSPDGIIQYSGNAAGGALNGKILVAEYSAGDDIVVLSKDASGAFTAERHITGLSGFDNPLSLAEDPSTGDVYVAELGGQRITLLIPTVAKPIATPSASLLVFNTVAAGNAGAGPSRAQTLTITNTGTSPLTIQPGGISIANDPSSTTQDASSFTITNLSSIPGSIAPGQSVGLNITYTATLAGIQRALLKVATNDTTNPVLNIELHGIGTVGLFGYNEPSLVRVLRAFDIPTIVGAGPNDANEANPTYPEVPDPSSQEIAMPRLVKAGTGPVTITPLASFDAAAQPAVRFGYYTPGDPTDRTELFWVNQSDDQTVSPTAQGATGFDPGSNPFSLYAVFPGISTANGQPDIHYSEDAFNTLDTTSMRKFRFFPLETKSGTVVPNAYVVAAEDFNSPQYNSFINFLGIIRNVKPAPGASAAAVLGLENLDSLPYTSRMIFNRIQVPNATLGDIVHDTNTLQIDNSGQQPLNVTGLSLSDASNWQLVNPPSLPATVAPGGHLDVTVRFIAQSDPPHSDNQTNDSQTTNGIPVAAAGGVWNGTLTISSNDPLNPTRAVALAGYWQYQSEHENEPSLQTIVNLMAGYNITLASTQQPDFIQGSTPVYYGQEVASGLWAAADPSLPVSLQMLDSFHNQGNTSVTSWYEAGSSSLNRLFQITADEGQSLLPHMIGTNNFAQASFTPSGAFGWNLDGENSQDSLNTVDITQFGRSGHAVRFWPLRDQQGHVIPNAWLMTMDYQNGEFDNYDYQDLAYIVTNMRPANAPPTPMDFSAFGSNQGGNQLEWAPVPSYPDPIGYDVYRSYNAAGPFDKLNPSSLSVTSYADTAAQVGTPAYYRVFAIDLTTGAQSVQATETATAFTTPANPIGGGNVQGEPATDLGMISRGTKTVRGTLTSTHTQDLYSFTVPWKARVTIRLFGLKRNADLQLLDGSLNVLASSTHPGKRNEVITITLDAGTYDISPYLVDQAGTPYRLSISVHLLPITGSLSSSNPSELIPLMLSAAARVNIQLGGLHSDADLQLLDSNQNVVKASNQPKNRGEVIVDSLAPGTYYVKPYMVDPGGTPFRLSVNVR